MFSFYRQLIWLRKSSAALRHGSYHALAQAPRRAQVYLREAPDQMMLVALNFSPHAVQVRLDEALPRAAWRLRLSTHAAALERVHSGAVWLEPHEACILEAA